MDLKNATILVTGASSGIGAAIARELSKAGAKVALAARSEEKLKEVAESLEGPNALVVPFDVTDPDGVKKGIEKVVEEFGSLDVLVNNAGLGTFNPLHELEIDEFDKMIDVNLRGTFICTKYALPHMYEQEKGAVVTIASLAGKNGFKGGSGYAASKFGAVGMMESLFHESRDKGVRSITINPGSVDTPFFDEAGVEVDNRDAILTAQDVAATVRHALELPENALIREVDIRPANPKK